MQSLLFRMLVTVEDMAFPFFSLSEVDPNIVLSPDLSVSRRKARLEI
jgi:hypothetical protein